MINNSIFILLASCLLLSCTTAEEREAIHKNQRAERLAALKLTCSEYGYRENTNAMAKCMQEEAAEARKRQAEYAAKLMEWGTAGRCRAMGNSYNKITGECTPPAQQSAETTPNKNGTIFDSNNNRVGTIRY